MALFKVPSTALQSFSRHSIYDLYYFEPVKRLCLVYGTFNLAIKDLYELQNAHIQYMFRFFIGLRLVILRGLIIFTSQNNHGINRFWTLLAGTGSTETNPPTFVYLTLLLYFIIFNTFSINMILQYKGVGKWKDYLYGERVYVLLSFTAKTILAWLVFVGVFSPF